nr:phage tail protein [Enterobacter roggenkampii]
MSQSVITTAFEQLKAQQAANGGVLTLDEFVFANIPNLNITDPIDRAESWPAVSQIVHRQAVSKTGMVNNNAVVYSVVLGADVGDFDFNWVGLINKASNTVAMIVHAPLQKKIKTASGQQGNVLTRSFLMEYDGASQQTQIITPVDTWQIDFTARLGGMDERQRKENIDIYGPAGFLGDGWMVSRNGSKYTVKQGVGYVSGLRAELLVNQDITVSAKPSKVWVDVCWRGTLTSTWSVVSKITVAPALANYSDNGEQHFVFALADILADGTVTDLRPLGSAHERNSQPLNALLTAFSRLNAGENKVPYFTGAESMALAAFTPFMRELSGQNDASAARDKLGIPGVISDALDAFLPKRSFNDQDLIRIPDRPGGLIIQFGTAMVTAQGGKLVFPTPFPSKCLAVIPVKSATAARYVTVGNFDASGANLWGWYNAGTAQPPDNFHYIAVGV